MSVPTVPAGWPPVPGLDKEEPRLWQEDDIPTDDTGTEREERRTGAPAARDAGSTGEPSRERPAGGAAPPGDADAQRTP